MKQRRTRLNTRKGYQDINALITMLAYLACMVLCLSLDTQRPELLFITVSVMLHCCSLQVDREEGRMQNSA